MTNVWKSQFSTGVCPATVTAKIYCMAVTDMAATDRGRHNHVSCMLLLTDCMRHAADLLTVGTLLNTFPFNDCSSNVVYASVDLVRT